jgi:hypothetical protein
MQADFHHRFTAAVMPARLNAYRQPGLSDLDVICCYLWNLSLSEALYPSLQTFEIGLRNALHNGLAFRFGRQDWYDHPRHFLDPTATSAIADAKKELSIAGKPFEPGRIVAELSFGFWTSLFNRKYEQPATRLWPQLVQRVFPHRPSHIFTRDHVAKRVESIRRLRNRAFHHERILHWPLQNCHADLLDAIYWISPTLHHAAVASDRFPTIYRQGWQNVRCKLTAFSLQPEYMI